MMEGGDLGEDLAGKWFLNEEQDQGFGGQVCVGRMRGRGCGGLGGFVWDVWDFFSFCYVVGRFEI